MFEIRAGVAPLAHHLSGAVVRIQVRGGTVVGSGSLVTDRYVATVAHVVADAFGVSEEEVELPGGVVSLDFPFVAPSVTRAATVVAWRPVRRQVAARSDIAVLEFGAPTPEGVAPARVTVVGNPVECTFRTCGFPAGHDARIWASGVLAGWRADGLLQVGSQTGGSRVGPGFGGALI